jgi:hypothetical protein
MMSKSSRDLPDDPRDAQQDDPKSGKSDDPRIDPRPSPGDRARQSDLTEEDMPAPRRREEAAQNLRLDP